MIFLKLGGSLITDKTQENTPRMDVIRRLAQEIKAALPHLQSPILLGHGSGSFGHMAAKKYGTRQGVANAPSWRGFAEVSVMAARLNRIVADCLHEAGVPVISVPPSASILCTDGSIQKMDTALIRTALSQGLVPLVMGDVALDSVRGGTIVSTEEVFGYLAKQFGISRMLLAGETEGVYEKYVAGETNAVIPKITPYNWGAVQSGVGQSRGADVTGGMAAKVRDMLALVQAHPSAQVHIFSGLIPQNLNRALHGENLGTLVTGEN